MFVTVLIKPPFVADPAQPVIDNPLVQALLEKLAGRGLMVQSFVHYLTHQDMYDMYGHVSNTPFWTRMVALYQSGPCLVLKIQPTVPEDTEFVSFIRGIIGASVNPAEGTLRRQFGDFSNPNIWHNNGFHCSDSYEAGEREWGLLAYRL